MRGCSKQAAGSKLDRPRLKAARIRQPVHSWVLRRYYFTRAGVNVEMQTCPLGQSSLDPNRKILDYDLCRYRVAYGRYGPLVDVFLTPRALAMS